MPPLLTTGPELHALHIANYHRSMMERAAASVLPSDFAFEWTGITYQELKAGSLATIIFALAIVFVFLILAAQYESWTMPFMVLLAVPLALFAALTSLWLRGMQIEV
jgi:HAE1 family hydrophobic/amphiphilic exporter-1